MSGEPGSSAHRVVLCTCPSPEVAGDLARALVSERLAACVNIVPGLRSIYRWQGDLCDDAETLLVIKTAADRVDALIERAAALHPYQVPELIALPIERGLPAYLDWITEQTR